MHSNIRTDTKTNGRTNKPSYYRANSKTDSDSYYQSDKLSKPHTLQWTYWLSYSSAYAFSNRYAYRETDVQPDRGAY